MIINPHRSGIALVLSMVILVMMLMLALPFMLSQNASVKSSDQFANTQDTSTARETVEALGLGIATDAFSEVYINPDIKAHHAIEHDTQILLDPAYVDTQFGSPILGSTRYEGSGYPLRMNFDLASIRDQAWAVTDDSSLELELIIEDESGKIDLNALSKKQWNTLLTKLNINYEPQQLANGFVNYRFADWGLKGKPYTQLEQLLKAPPSGVDPRPALTHAELDRLRPYVTAHGMGQGKDGQQELGNVIVAADPNTGDKYAVLDTHPGETPLPNDTFFIFSEDPKFHTNINDLTTNVAAVCMPVPQALNINTASAVALDAIGINMTYLIEPIIPATDRSGERRTFKEISELPEKLRDRISSIDDKDTESTSDDVSQIPIDVASSGMVSIRSRAEKYDRNNKPASRSSREIVALALSSESSLKKEFADQTAMHKNVLSQQSSLMASWPRAVERKNDNDPNIGALWKGLVTDLADRPQSFMKPKPLPDLHDANIYPNGGWTKLFGKYDEDIPPGFSLEDDVGPDGVESQTSSGTTIAYDHEKTVAGQKTSFAEPHFVSGGDPQQMEARQISFWLTTPDETDFASNWVDKTVPIFELRAPEENTGAPIDPSGPNDGHSVWDPLLTETSTMDYRKTNGDNSKQHYLALYYDGTEDLEHFVLSVAGEIIEIPDAVFGAPFNPQNNHSIPGQDDRTNGGGTHPLSNPQNLTWSEHRYIHKLNPGQSYDIQITLQNSKPGGMHIIINGLVGRDLTQLASFNISEILPGDHFTTPYPLELTSSLPEITQSMTPGNKITDDQLREVGSISARGLNLPSAWDSILTSPSDWLPNNSNGTAHGMMNINGEFIAYKNWSESSSIYTFQDCKRGCRQLTNDQDEIGKTYTSHGLSFTLPPEPGLSADSYRLNMPAHASQSQVWPGGLSFERDTTLYRGGCVLMTPIGDGVSTDQRIRTVTSQEILGADSNPNILVDDASLFPDRGIIKVRGRSPDDNYPPSSRTWDDDADPMTPEVAIDDGDGEREEVVEIMYYRKSGNTLTIHGRFLFGSNSFASDMITTDPDDATRTYETSILLVSWEVETDPTGKYRDPGQGQTNTLTPGYAQGNVPDATTPVSPGGQTTATATSMSNWISHDHLQLYDVTNTSPLTYGAIEWINYTDTEVIDPGALDGSLAGDDEEYYFLNRNGGYGSGRGVLGTHFDATRIWPAQTRILPVQTAGKFGYLMAAGDVVTLSANQLGAADITYRDTSGEHARKFSTWQTIIRYASQNTHDGYHWVDTGAGWGPDPYYPKEIRFAFTEELPDFPTNAMVSVWPSWSNEDLTLYKISNISPNQFNATNFPFINAWATNFDDNVSRKVHFGSQDDARLPNPSPPAPPWVNNMPGILNDAVCTFDSIAAVAPLSGRDHQLPTVISASASSIVVTQGPGFSYSLKDRTGCVLIQGEVLAYEIGSPPASSEVELTIVGRSLFGSTQAVTIDVGDEVLRLPFGAVARLDSGLADNAAPGIVELRDITDISTDELLFRNTKSFIICKSDGSAYEMVQLIPERNHLHCAPWLRGMYNTPIQTWAADDLVIAWTPRYASALPQTSSITDPEHQSALLRSRSYAWIGAGMRIFGMKLDGTVDPSAKILVKHNPLSAFNFEVRALDQGFDWAGTNTLLADTPAGTAVDGAQLALPTEFTSVWEPEGGDFDLRVHWRYNDVPYTASDEPYEQLLSIGARANTAPSIRSLELNAQSQVHILDATVNK